MPLYSNILVIERVSNPGKLDVADYLTICRSEDNNVYIQMSRDENVPRWEHLGKGKDIELLLNFLNILKLK